MQKPLNSSPSYLAQVRATLLSEQSKLRARLNNNGHSVFVAQLQGTEKEDRPKITEHHQVEETHCQREMRHVDEALERLDKGTFGHCVDCGESIDPERLAAYPTASRCLPCQKEYDNNVKKPKRK